jgi:hypothetical protein
LLLEIVAAVLIVKDVLLRIYFLLITRSIAKYNDTNFI